MSTPRQREANRANAQRSTGPRTERGRAAVASNPLIHGFYARVAIPTLEDPADYHVTLADFMADLRPAGAVEVELVHRYVKDLWKLRRYERLERMYLNQEIEKHEASVDLPLEFRDQRAVHAYFDIIDLQFYQFKNEAPIERITMLQHRLRRALESTLRQLRELQRERLASAAPGETFAVTATIPPDPHTYIVDLPDRGDPTLAPEATSSKQPESDAVENPPSLSTPLESPPSPAANPPSGSSPPSESAPSLLTPDRITEPRRVTEPRPQGAVDRVTDPPSSESGSLVGQTSTSAPDLPVRPERDGSATPRDRRGEGAPDRRVNARVDVRPDGVVNEADAPSEELAAPPSETRTTENVPPPAPSKQKPNPEIGFVPPETQKTPRRKPSRRGKRG